MTTVKNLVEILKGLNPEMKVLVGMSGIYNMNFVMEGQISINEVDFYNNDNCECVIITQCSQIVGTCYNHKNGDA